MHHHKSQLQIGRENCVFFSNFNPNSTGFSPSIHQSTPRDAIISFTPTSNQPQNHLLIQIQPPHQPRNEPIKSPSKTLLSAPHKRPVMSQIPSAALPHSPTVSSSRRHHFHKPSVADSNPSRPCCNCSSSFASLHLSAAREIARKLIRYSRRARWLRLHLQLFVLLSFPSIYFFTLIHHWPFLLHFVSIIAFSAVLLIAFNFSLPRLPSIRLFLPRSLPIKLLPSITTKAKPQPPVVWSIGSKPKSGKTLNSGSWVQMYRNGDVYEGEFHKGKSSGSGVYYYYMSGRYEGDWIDEKYDGHGVETWAKGSRYRGQYRQGLRHGCGIYRFYTGDVYAGEWCNGQCHGYGVYTCDDGSRYLGEFKWGVKHGLGHYYFRNGDTYGGEYFADKMHGFGVYRFGNGHRYEGGWHEGRRQGFGMYTFRNGDTQSGHWQNGVLDISTTPDEAKVLHAVQEARRAMEKASGAGKVDERVNRAVAVANKAANAARVAAVKAVQNQLKQYQ